MEPESARKLNDIFLNPISQRKQAEWGSDYPLFATSSPISGARSGTKHQKQRAPHFMWKFLFMKQHQPLKITFLHDYGLSLIHISEPTRLGMISYAVFCLKKKKTKNKNSL